ncbi:hypothetical protein P5V15_015734 [Pogonomyrmex californicus]
MGRTTFAFFKDVRDRLAMRSLEANHYITQALTGHGNFRARLNALGLASDDACPCGSPDTVQFPTALSAVRSAEGALRGLVPQGGWRWPNAAQFFVSSPRRLRRSLVLRRVPVAEGIEDAHV